MSRRSADGRMAARCIPAGMVQVSAPTTEMVERWPKVDGVRADMTADKQHFCARCSVPGGSRIFQGYQGHITNLPYLEIDKVPISTAIGSCATMALSH